MLVSDCCAFDSLIQLWGGLIPLKKVNMDACLKYAIACADINLKLPYWLVSSLRVSTSCCTADNGYQLRPQSEMVPQLEGYRIEFALAVVVYQTAGTEVQRYHTMIALDLFRLHPLCVGSALTALLTDLCNCVYNCSL